MDHIRNHIHIMTSIDVTQWRNSTQMIKYESERGFRAALPSRMSAALPVWVMVPPRPASDANHHSLKVCEK